MEVSKQLAAMPRNELVFEVNRGARIVLFQYCISLLVITFRRNSSVQFVAPGESAAVKSLPYTLLSLLLGWWGLPWGFIYTPTVIYKNLKGGTDVTASFLNQAQQTPNP